MAKDMKVAYLLDFYGDLLTEKQREALELYYNEDLSLGEISSDLGITRQGVRENVKRAEAILLEMEEKLGLAAKSGEISRSLGEVRRCIDIIDDKNMRIYRSDEINESIKVILRELEKLKKLNE